MGSTIGINTMILFASVFFIVQAENPGMIQKRKSLTGKFLWLTNISLLIFWISMLAMGVIKISGKLNNQAFQTIMARSRDFFSLFTYSGVLVMVGLSLLAWFAVKSLSGRN